MVLIRIVAQPFRRRWQPARRGRWRQRAGDRRLVSRPRAVSRTGTGVARAGARGDLLAGDGTWITGAMAVTPAHQVNVNMVVVIDVRARRQHGGELIAGRSL